MTFTPPVIADGLSSISVHQDTLYSLGQFSRFAKSEGTTLKSESVPCLSALIKRCATSGRHREAWSPNPSLGSVKK